MANQDILYDMWMRSGQPRTSVHIRTIGSFASMNRRYLTSHTSRGISSSGIDYAVLKFILEYTIPVNWPPGVWEKFYLAKDPRDGNYATWRRYTSLLVDIRSSQGYPALFPSVKSYSVPFTSQPPGADIRIDEIYRGRTPVTIQNIMAGDRVIECVKTHYGSETRTILISGESPVHFDLKPLRSDVSSDNESVTQPKLPQKDWFLIWLLICGMVFLILCIYAVVTAFHLI